MRLIYLILGSSLLTYTTTPNQLTDGLETMLKPLEKIKVPVHDFVHKYIVTSLSFQQSFDIVQVYLRPTVSSAPRAAVVRILMREICCTG